MIESAQQPISLLRAYLYPYAFLIILYLLVMGGGSAWLYLSARHAQTELITTHILDITKPVIKQLHKPQTVNDTNYSLKLSDKVAHLFQIFPHLRQVSVRNHQKGYGVRLTSTRQIVDVELEPLANDFQFPANHQEHVHRLHNEETPFFSIYFEIASPVHGPELFELAFDRSGLVGQIGSSLQSLINAIALFSVSAIFSILLALVISIHIGRKAIKTGALIQTLYQQSSTGALATALVHDLRNPLASIRANIKNVLITPEATREVVAEMDQDLLRLDSKLSGFLKLTKPPTGILQPVDINTFSQDLIRVCKPLFKEKNQSFSIDIAADIPPVALRSEDMHDALLNLLINAREHTPDKGHIGLKIHCNQGNLEIIIENDGPAISKEVLPHIFEPFFTTRNDGHGLGLAIVKRTVKAHQGSIKAENNSPTGTRFIITLPIKHG
jgi:signal transduction histidine kinase